MRIHANTLTADDIYDAVRDANCNLIHNTGIRNICVQEVTEHGSRSRVRAFDVFLSGDSSRNTQNRNYRAATWDQWGEFLAALFRADDSVTIPQARYGSAAEFHWATAGRYALDGNFQYCRQHSFKHAGTAVTGSYYNTFRCGKCDALMRQGDFSAVSA